MVSRRPYTWASGDVCDVSGGQVRIASSVDRCFRNSNGKFILLYLYRIWARYVACDSNECVCDSANRWRGLSLLSRDSHSRLHVSPILDGIFPVASSIAEKQQSGFAGVCNSGHEPEGTLVCVSTTTPVRGSRSPCIAAACHPNDLHCGGGCRGVDIICLSCGARHTVVSFFPIFPMARARFWRCARRLRH